MQCTYPVQSSLISANAFFDYSLVRTEASLWGDPALGSGMEPHAPGCLDTPVGSQKYVKLQNGIL
jgi:hypothetical protein